MTPEQISTAIGESKIEIGFVTHPSRIYMLIGLLQTALRHPQVPQFTAGEARVMVGQFADMLAKDLDLPEIRDLVEIGYLQDAEMTDEEFDQLFQLEISDILQRFKSADPSADNN